MNQINSKILIYTFFRAPFVSKFLYEYENKNIDKFYVSGKNGVVKLCNKVLAQNYNFIIGFGGSSISARRVRVDKRFINKFGKSILIDIEDEFLFSNLEINLQENMYDSESTTNSICNKSMFYILHTIKNYNLNTKAAFLHVPKKFNTPNFLFIIENIINNLYET